MRLSTELYTRVNCGLRQVVKILTIVNDAFDGILGEIPCYNTVVNWMKKCGLNEYETSAEPLKNEPYAQIMDESMMVGSEKMLAILGVPSEHPGRPLNCSDVRILDIAVAPSWNGEGIGKRLKAASEKVGHDPLYVVSDNASIMNKGVKCAQFTHQHDISHSLGMYLERTYKDEADFVEYLKLMTEPKFKHNMKKIAYLLPPKQRTISRFINLSEWVEWSSKMLDIHHTLQKNEQEVFSFVPANASLIDELSDVVKCVKRIEHICKHTGLSKSSVSACNKEIGKYLLCGNDRMIRLGGCLLDFLAKEVLLVGENISAHNNSSDILESLFGMFKGRKSLNKLNGVTSYVLMLPIYTRLSEGSKAALKFDFKAALEAKHMRDIDAWAKDHLSPNLMSMRSKRLRHAG